jgi:hypothetical protein
MLRAIVAGPPTDLFAAEKSTIQRASSFRITMGQEIGIGQFFQIGVSGKSRLQYLLNG